MTKRKLSDQQARRIAAIQEERRRRAQRQNKKVDDMLDSGHLGPEEHGLLITHYGTQADIERDDGSIHRCLLRQNLGLLACGDRVIWRSAAGESGVVVALQTRRSVLGRPDRQGDIRPVAANIDQMIIVAAPEPALQTYLIDSYLVAAETLHIQPLICLNKVDLLKDTDPLFDIVARYQHLGYTVIHASCDSKKGLQALAECLKGNVSVFVGQSGVGKSSLIAAFLPQEDIRVGEISAQTKLGRHTTSNSRLYHLQTGGDLIDSPGIREFGLWHMQPRQIAEGFVEFREYLDQCKFRDCSHVHEPDCALRQAVQAGDIDLDRLHNFHKLCSGGSA